MSLFESLNVSASGMDTYQTWLNALGGNIANMNDTVRTNQPVYQTQYVEAAPTASTGPMGVGEGVAVSGVALGPSTGMIVHDPTSPLADAQGNVRQPKVDLGEQMVQLIEAQNSYQASVSAFSQARQAYESALQIPNGVTG